MTIPKHFKKPKASSRNAALRHVFEERYDRVTEWTLAHRKRGGGSTFRRVPNLALATEEQIIDLVVYLVTHDREQQWVRVPTAEWEARHPFEHANHVLNRRGNGQWNLVRMTDTGELPWDTEPHKRFEFEEKLKEVEDFFVSGGKPDTDKMTPRMFQATHAKARPDGGIQAIEVQSTGQSKAHTGWFNIYDGDKQIGEVDYSPTTVSNQQDYPWTATAHLWKLDGATQDTNISDLGRFASLKDAVDSVELIVRNHQVAQAEGKDWP